MANLKSSKLAIKKSRKRAERNKGVRSAIKTAMKKARTAITEGADDAAELVRQAASLADKAAKRNIIHPNAANRRKARLAKRQKAEQTAA